MNFQSLKRILLALFLSIPISYFLTLWISKETLTNTLQFIFVFIYFLLLAMLACIILMKKISNVKKKEKLIFLFPVCIVSCLILFNTQSFLHQDILDSYQNSPIIIRALGDKTEESKGFEVWIKNISVDQVPIDLNTISVSGNWQYRLEDNFLLTTPAEGENSDLILNLPEGREVEIIFLKHPWSGNIQIICDDTMETEILYSEDSDECVYTLERKLIVTPIEKTLFVSVGYYFLLTVLFYYISMSINIKWIKKNRSQTYLLIKVIFHNICTDTIVTFFLSLPFTKLIPFYVLNFLCILFYYRRKKISKLLIMERSLSRFAFILIHLYITFSFFGKQIFLPLGKLSIEFKDIALFLLMSVAIYPFVVSCIYLFEMFGAISHSNKENTNGVNANYKFLAVIFVLQLAALFIFNPGLMTVDSFDQYAQAHGYANYNDHHPIFHTFIQSIIYRIVDHPIIISLVQIAVNTFVLFQSTLLLKRIKYSTFFLYLYILLMTLLPNIFITNITLWKDIPFTTALLYCSYLFAKLYIEKKDFYQRSNVIHMIITLALISLLRHNGIIILMGCSLFFVIQFMFQKKWYILFISIASITLALVANTALSELLNASPNGNVASVIPFHGMSYVCYENQELPSETEQYLTNYLSLDAIRENYHPYSANTYMYNEVSIQNQTLNKFRATELSVMLPQYLKTLIKYPFLVIKDRLYGTDILWNVAQSNTDPFVYNYRYANFYDIEQNQYGVKHIDTPFTNLYFSFLDLTTRSRVIDMFLWRGGIYLDLYLLLLFYCYLKNRSYRLMVFLPIVFNTASLFISMAWQDYRYIYYLCFCFPFLFLFLLKDRNQEKARIENATDGRILLRGETNDI